jgi:hypothetical protein
VRVNKPKYVVLWVQNLMFSSHCLVNVLGGGGAFSRSATEIKLKQFVNFEIFDIQKDISSIITCSSYHKQIYIP